MGCGSGIQGVVCGLYGAKKVIFSDLSPAAINNTKENVIKFGIEDKSEIIEGDLFEKINKKADVIIFNHPFFSDLPFEKLLASKAMLDRGKLINRFFEDSKNHLESNGSIIMPYFHLAGPVNDPGVQAPKHNYRVEKVFQGNVKQGLQKGPISIFKIEL